MGRKRVEKVQTGHNKKDKKQKDPTFPSIIKGILLFLNLILFNTLYYIVKNFKLNIKHLLMF